jgi:hypothetical protein
VGDCTRRVTISADAAERAVSEAVQDRLAGMRGTAAIGDGLEAAERDLEARERGLAAAVEAFTGLEDVAAVRDKLLALREARDQARDRVAGLQAVAVPAVTVTAADWKLLTVEEQRALIRAFVRSATVAPGRGGADRITVEAVGE